MKYFGVLVCSPKSNGYSYLLRSKRTQLQSKHYSNFLWDEMVGKTLRHNFERRYCEPLYSERQYLESLYSELILLRTNFSPKMKKGEIGEIEETKIEISTFIGLFREFHVILCFNSMKKCKL